MNKSKFKFVKFLPFDLDLEYFPLQERWANSQVFGNALSNNIAITDSCIKTYPELFEVEEAESEFEEGAYYKATLGGVCSPEIIQRNGGVFHRMGIDCIFEAKDFCDIGEKIEL